jgi:hypothetical protein
VLASIAYLVVDPSILNLTAVIVISKNLSSTPLADSDGLNVSDEKNLSGVAGVPSGVYP